MVLKCLVATIHSHTRGGHALFCSGCTIAIRDFQQGHLHVAQLLYLKIFYRATVGSPPFLPSKAPAQHSTVKPSEEICFFLIEGPPITSNLKVSMNYFGFLVADFAICLFFMVLRSCAFNLATRSSQKRNIGGKKRTMKE